MSAQKQTPRGIGIGYRPAHYRWIADNRPAVNWFEIITENFLCGGGRPRRFLEQLRRDYPVVMHGVGLSLGSTDPFNDDYLRRWQKLIREIEPAMVSDHLCWTTHGGNNSHDLLPLPYTAECLAHIKSRINFAQELIKRPLLIENPSMYVAFARNDMNEAEFLRELCQSTGCKLLLDLNNLFVNFCNTGIDPLKYLSTIPIDAVAQFHLAGHSVNPEVRIDTHDHPICDEVWSLYAYATQRWPNVPTLIEWDDHIPDFPDLMAVGAQAESAAKSFREAPVALSPKAEMTFPVGDTQSPPASLAELQSLTMQLITSRDGSASHVDKWDFFAAQIPVPRHVGLSVYNQAYFLRIRDNLKDIFPALYYLCEDDGFSALVADYLQSTPQKHYNIKFTGECFSDFLANGSLSVDFGIPQQVLADIAALEWAKALIFDCPDESSLLGLNDLAALSAEDWDSLTMLVKGAVSLLETTYDALTFIECHDNQSQPPAPVAGVHRYLVHRLNHTIKIERVGAVEFAFLQKMLAGQRLRDIATSASDTAAPIAEELPQLLAKWCGLQLLTGYRI